MKFLDTEDIAKRYNSKITANTVANWRSQGKGPEYFKIGGRVFYTLEAVEKWEQSRMFKGGRRNSG